MLNRRDIQPIADFVVDFDARVAFIAKYADLDQLMRFKVDFDLFQHGVGQTLRADEHNGLERVRLGTQIGTLGREEGESWHEKFGTRLTRMWAACGRVARPERTRTLFTRRA